MEEQKTTENNDKKDPEKADNKGTDEKNKKDENEKEEEEEESEQINLSKCQKCYLYPIFIFIDISTIIFLYVGMVFMTMAFIPVLINLLISAITRFTLDSSVWFKIVGNVLTVFVWYPIFALFISIILTLFSSVFYDFLSDAKDKVFDFKRFARRYANAKNKVSMTVQMILYVLFFALSDAMLIASNFTSNEKFNNFASYFLIFFYSSNIIFAVIGVFKVLLMAWVIILFPVKDVDELKMHNEVSETESEYDTTCEQLILLDEHDPGGLRNMKDWVELMKNDQITHYKTIRNKVTIFRAIFATLNILQIFFSTVSAFDEYKETQRYAAFFLPVASLLAFPFCTLLNITVVFSHTTEKKNKVGIGSLKTLLVACAFFLVIAIPVIAVAIGVICIVFEKEHQNPEILYSYKPVLDYTDIRRKYRLTAQFYPSYCKAVLLKTPKQNLYIEDIAVLMTIGEYIEKGVNQKAWDCSYGKYRSSVRSIMQYVFSESFSYITSTHTCIDNTLMTSLLNVNEVTEKKNMSFVIAKGLYNRVSIAALIEIYIQQYFPELITTIIPFADTVIALFADAFSYVQVLAQSSMGILPIVDTVARSNVNSINNITRGRQRSMIGIGQSIGGYLIKEIAYAKNMSGISFDSLPLFQTVRRLYKESVIEAYGKIGVNLLNVVFNNSLISSLDDSIDQNYIVPSKFNKMPMDTFDAACMVAATCDTRNRYSGFCEQVYKDKKGIDFYKDMITEAMTDIYVPTYY